MIYAYAVKRQTLEGDEYLDPETVSRFRASSQDRADTIDEETPTWAKRNPQLGIVPIEFQEVT